MLFLGKFQPDYKKIVIKSKHQLILYSQRNMCLHILDRSLVTLKFGIDFKPCSSCKVLDPALDVKNEFYIYFSIFRWLTDKSLNYITHFLRGTFVCLVFMHLPNISPTYHGNKEHTIYWSKLICFGDHSDKIVE